MLRNAACELARAELALPEQAATRREVYGGPGNGVQSARAQCCTTATSSLPAERRASGWGGVVDGTARAGGGRMAGRGGGNRSAGRKRVWISPIETVSESEEGFERVYQGSQILAVWNVESCRRIVERGNGWRSASRNSLVALRVRPALRVSGQSRRLHPEFIPRSANSPRTATPNRSIGLAAEAVALRHRGNILRAIFVRTFRPDRFAFCENDTRARARESSTILIARRSQVHFHRAAPSCSALRDETPPDRNPRPVRD